MISEIKLTINNYEIESPNPIHPYGSGSSAADDSFREDDFVWLPMNNYTRPVSPPPFSYRTPT